MDDFLQSLPLVQMLAHTSMRSRHWQQLMSLTNKHLAVGSDSFKLIHLLEADLLEVLTKLYGYAHGGGFQTKI